MDMHVAADVCQLAIRASEDDIRGASEWLEQVCSERNVPAEQIFRLDLCLNEALANIIAHGGVSPLEAPVVLTLDTGPDQAQTRASLTVSDTGKPFNPILAPTKPKALTLADATPGGLGLTMISSYSDQLDYAFRDGRNQLTFIIRWDASE